MERFFKKNATWPCSAYEMDTLLTYHRSQYNKNEWEVKVNWNFSRLTDNYETARILARSRDMAKIETHWESSTTMQILETLLV